MAEIRVEREEKRSMLPWILGLLLLALVLWGISGMMGRDGDTVEDSGASAVGVTIQQQPPALRQYAALTTEVLADAA